MALAYIQLANGAASFTPADDATWGVHDAQDILGTIPVNAVLDILLENNNTGNEYSMGVRAKDSVLVRFTSVHEAEAGGYTHGGMLVQTDSDGAFEAYSSDVSRTTHHIVGYFTGVTYTETADLFSDNSQDDAWHDKDLNTDYGYPGDRVYEIWCNGGSPSIPTTLGVRTNGSGVDRKIEIHESEGGGQCGYATFVEADAGGIIEVYADTDITTSYKVFGYFDSAVGFNERQDTLDAAGDAGWENEALNGYGVPASAVIIVICLNGEFGAENEIGVREDGTAIDRKWDEHEAESADGVEYTGFRLCVTAGSDANRTIDIYEEDTSENVLYHQGWFTYAAAPVGTNPGFSIIPLMVATGMIA